MASLWKLPVIYICENNQYTEYTPYKKSIAGDILARAKAFGVRTKAIDGQDVRGVYSNAIKMVERARKGKGPEFLLCTTYRYHGHHVGDVDRSYYRTKAEEKTWRTKHDPIERLSHWLLTENLANQKLLDQIHTDTSARIQAAQQLALDASYPDEREVDQHVYT